MLKNYSSFTKKEIINAFFKLQLRLWLILVLVLVGIAYVSYGIYTIVIVEVNFVFLFAGISFLTIAIALAIIPYVLAYKANKEVSDIEYELVFYDDYFDIKIKKGLELKESSIEYKNILKKVRKGDIFYIYINRNQAILLKLSSFNENDKESFLNLMKGI
ncbi:MAG: YcxB family protein [Acholeplasmatales bacterium]|nr:YcxB family protein [Acholeplasmatales bacterium]